MPTPSRRVQSIARHQDRLMTVGQIERAGVSRGQWRSLVRRGEVHRVFGTVFVLGVPTLTQRELLTATELRFPGLAWGAHTALTLRRCLPTRLGLVTAWIPSRLPDATPIPEVPMTNGRSGRVRLRSWRNQVPPTVERADGRSLTSVPRALVDLAAGDYHDLLGRAWLEAEFRCLLDPKAVTAELALARTGSKRVARLLDERFPVTRPGDDVRSRRERAFLRALSDRGVERPAINQLFRLDDGYECRPDFLWAREGVVALIDPEQHDLKPRDRADKVQSAILQTAGLAVLQFAGATVDRDVAWCADLTAETLRSRG